MRDQILNRVFDLGTIDLGFRRAARRDLKAKGTNPAACPLAKLGVRPKPVFEVIDTKVGSFGERHRAKMASHLQPSRVRRFDRGAKLCACNQLIRLK